jgi:hypothetical protein
MTPVAPVGPATVESAPVGPVAPIGPVGPVALISVVICAAVSVTNSWALDDSDSLAPPAEDDSTTSRLTVEGVPDV